MVIEGSQQSVQKEVTTVAQQATSVLSKGKLAVIAHCMLYVTVHGKTNHIALELNLRYEPNKSPGVTIINFDFLA